MGARVGARRKRARVRLVSGLVAAVCVMTLVACGDESDSDAADTTSAGATTAAGAATTAAGGAATTAAGE